MKRLKTILLLSVIIVSICSDALAGQITKQPLIEVFDQVVILPYDFNNKVFAAGKKIALDSDYQLVQRQGRVFVPIRLMAYLANEVPGSEGTWQVHWDPQFPLKVKLFNYTLDKQITLTAGSKTMTVNNQANVLADAPDKIEGRVMLPLRSVAEALGLRIEWLDGLIILSQDYVDLQHEQTLAIIDKVKAQLLDPRSPISYEQVLRPIMKQGDTIYYVKTQMSDSYYREELYKKTADQPEVKIELPGNPNFTSHKILNGELFYSTKIADSYQLYIFNFAENTFRKCCDLINISPFGGWIGDLRLIDDELYIVIHQGDLTMGVEDLYRCVDGQLQHLARAKSFINYTLVNGYLYYTDFVFMSNPTHNFYQVDLDTGEKTQLGAADFTYGVMRVFTPQGGIYYTQSNKMLHIDTDYAYVLGYQEQNDEDKPAVYRINLSDCTQKKLTGAARKVTIREQQIYYLDADTGYLMRTDFEESEPEVLVGKAVLDYTIHNDQVYYLASDNVQQTLGQLYCYGLISGTDKLLSDQLISKFWVYEDRVFYEAEGYDLGLYKIDQAGQKHCIVDDSINNVIITSQGLVYTLTYAEGVYTAE